MKKLVIDSGALLLFTIGAADRRYLTTHKRVRGFGVDGFSKLTRLIAKFDQLLVTPHSLTETWNLAVNDHSNDGMSNKIRLQLVSPTELAMEIYTPSIELAESREFLRLGFADMGQLCAAISHRCPLITSDGALYRAAVDRKLEAINLNQIDRY